MSIESRLTDVEESLRLLRNANRLQGRHLSAAAPTNNYYLGWNGTTKKWEPKGFVLVRKTEDETVNNDTLQDDNHLSFAVAVNEVWAIEMFLAFESTTVADLKLHLALPSGASVRWSTSQHRGGTSGDPVYLSSAGDFALSGESGQPAIHVMGTIIVSTTAGNAQLQWAQNTTEASDTKILANSWLKAHQL